MKRTASILLAVLAILLQAAPAAAEGVAHDLYFIAIGNQHSPASSGAELAPVNSAKRVAEALVRMGARYGLVLQSDPTHGVSKADMKAGLVALKAKIRSDRAAHPMIVFYYMGHGYGDPYNQWLYLAPGDRDLRPLTSQRMTGSLSALALTNFDVITSLELFRLPRPLDYLDDVIPSDFFPSSLADIKRIGDEAHYLTDTDRRRRAEPDYPTGKVPPVPFIVLFDNCYSDVTDDLTSPESRRGVEAWLGPALGQSYRAFIERARVKIISEFNEAQSDGLVLYAAKPGEPISEFEDPNGDDPLPVGALARRLLYVLRTRPTGGITLRAFRTALNDPRAATYEAAGSAAHDVNVPEPYYLQAASDAVLDGVRLPMGRDGEGRAVVETRLGTASIEGR